MTESTFKLRTLGSDTMLNYHLSQKLKLIGRDKFNHYINTLTKCREELVPWALSPSHANLNLFRTKLIGLFLDFMVLMQIPKELFMGRLIWGFGCSLVHQGDFNVTHFPNERFGARLTTAMWDFQISF
jgi:hypothetical protein